MSWTNEEIEEAFKIVRKKAMVDKKFRDLLKTDPNKAISEAVGKEVPDALKIKIIDSDPAYHMTFVLPEMISEELTDELDNVAGGLSVALIISVCGAAVGAGPDTGACGAEMCLEESCAGNVCGAAR